MGGVSTSSFRLTNGVAVFQGKLLLENNGGFASVRSLPARHDAAGGDTFVVRVRGDGRRYKFTARTAPSFDSAIYQCTFTTKKGEWEEHRLPFRQFVASYGNSLLHAAREALAGHLILCSFETHQFKGGGNDPRDLAGRFETVLGQIEADIFPDGQRIKQSAGLGETIPTR